MSGSVELGFYPRYVSDGFTVDILLPVDPSNEAETKWV